MSSIESIQRWLTELDYVRLSKLTGGNPPSAMADVFDAAEVVPSPEIRPDVVTMYSQVLVSDCDTGAQSKLTVCYPNDAEPGEGFVSVLSPVGTALLGQRTGARVTFSAPGGSLRRLRIDAILFQPEATGDYTL